MASEKVQSAAAGASAGAKIGSVVPGVGTAIGAGIGAITGALFGGGGTYAQTKGHAVTGTVSKAGFSGDFIGLAANGGQQYRDPLPQSGLNDVARVTFREVFGDSDAVIPISYVGSPDSETFWEQFRNLIRSAGKNNAAALTAAPDYLQHLQSAFNGSGSAIAAPAVSYGGAANGDSAGIVLSAPKAPDAGGGLGLIALLAGALYAVAHV